MLVNKLKNLYRVVTRDGKCYIYIAEEQVFVSNDKQVLYLKHFNRETLYHKGNAKHDIMDIFEQPEHRDLLDPSFGKERIWQRPEGGFTAAININGKPLTENELQEKLSEAIFYGIGHSSNAKKHGSNLVVLESHINIQRVMDHFLKSLKDDDC